MIQMYSTYPWDLMFVNQRRD